jgi:hypothetical protein
VIEGVRREALFHGNVDELTRVCYCIDKSENITLGLKDKRAFFYHAAVVLASKTVSCLETESRDASKPVRKIALPLLAAG